MEVAVQLPYQCLELHCVVNGLAVSVPRLKINQRLRIDPSILPCTAPSTLPNVRIVGPLR